MELPSVTSDPREYIFINVFTSLPPISLITRGSFSLETLPRPPVSLFEFYSWGIACAAVGAPQLEFNLRTERNARSTRKPRRETKTIRKRREQFVYVRV